MVKVSKRKIEKGTEKYLKTQAVISHINKMEEEEQAASLARSSGLPYVDLNIFPFSADDIRIIPEEDSHKYNTAIFKNSIFYSLTKDSKTYRCETREQAVPVPYCFFLSI